MFNTGGRIDDHKLKFLAQVLAELLHLHTVDGVLVSRLGSREQVELWQALIFDQGLAQAALSLDNIDEIVNDTILQS